MRNLICTDDLPAPDRLAFWREEVMPQTWVPLECGVEDGQRFQAWLHSSDLGVIQVNVITSTPLHVRRTPRLIRRAAPDLLKVVLALDGRGRPEIVQDGRHAQLGQGDFALYDTTRPFEVRAAGDGVGTAVTLHFPRSLLPLPEREVTRLTAVPIRADSGLGRLTSQFLRQLAAGVDRYRPAEATRLATAALEILAARLAHELDDGRALPPETHQRALLARVHAFIEEHLGDRDLSPRTVAAAHYVSVRYLHKLFSEQAQTVAGWIRTRRLERCRRDLSDPALAVQPVAAIAARWGFASAAHFSQLFKSAYGLPPQEYRRQAQQHLGPGENGHGAATPRLVLPPAV